MREASQLNTKGRIIILDEAHNIEQVCRDAGTGMILTSALDPHRVGGKFSS